ncbi:MAG: flagellar hook-basal body complex protein FliE [Treponema sp.]|nr:flagellar hook-basal body complex protein FliE [Treponema sp.]
MIISEFGTLQMTRTEPEHFGNTKIKSLTENLNSKDKTFAINSSESEGKSFQSYLLEAVNNVNSNQNNVSSLQEKLITNPDEVDVHDVTIAMSKARMSLNLAQTVIDRLVTDWNEISTTR